jgi:cell division septal protein FtsQ
VLALLLVVVGTASGLPVLGYLGYRQVLASGYFAPRNITVSGHERVSRDTIVDAAGLNDAGVSLFDFDTDEAAERIAALPWIADATVHKNLPDEVFIEVSERGWRGAILDEELLLVGEDGELIEAYDGKNVRLEGPIVSGKGLAKWDADARARAEQAFEIASLYESTGLHLRAPLSQVDADPLLGFSLFVGRTEVRLGTDRFEQRLQRLGELFAALDERKVEAEYVLLDLERLDHAVIKARPRLSLSPPPSAEPASPEKVVVKAKKKSHSKAKPGDASADTGATQVPSAEPALEDVD